MKKVNYEEMVEMFNDFKESFLDSCGFLAQELYYSFSQFYLMIEDGGLVLRRLSSNGITFSNKVYKLNNEDIKSILKFSDERYGGNNSDNDLLFMTYSELTQKLK